MLKFSFGDRVTRPKDVYELSSPLMHGTIVCVYGRKDCYPHINYSSVYPELYDVRWDNKEKINRAFLPHGLDKE